MSIINDLLMDYKRVYKVQSYSAADGWMNLSVVEYDNGELNEGEEISYPLFFSQIENITHISDLDNICSIFKSEDFIEKIDNKEKIASTFLMKFDDEYIPIVFEIVYSNDSIYFTFRKTSKRNNLLEDSVRTIYKSYLKILKVNISTDAYEEIKLSEHMHSKSFSESINHFASEGVFYQDLKDFLEFMDLENMKDYFEDNKSKKMIFRYRRICLDKSIRWVAVELFPCREFTKDNQLILMYIKDIHDDYSYQLKEQRKMQYLLSHDCETGLKNKFAFMDDMENHNNIKGIIKVRVNDIANIAKFTTYLSLLVTNTLYYYETYQYATYRISNDEFIIVFINDDMLQYQFDSVADILINDLSKYGVAGKFFNEDSITNIDEIIYEVDQDMYDRVSNS